jgi:pyruvate/2-oxoglutarate dehydrogenase complex dihydrolipoamide acyltransferase (E2) component
MIALYENAASKAETKPSPQPPQEGDTVNLPPQSKYSTTPRKMVFKDGQWKQEVGGEITSVGEPVQKQAQEAFSGKKEAKAEETKPAAKAPETKPAETKPAEFTSKQESSASEEFDGTKKPSKIKMKTFDNKHGKGAFERMQNITQNFEDIMDGLSDKIKQDCL